MGETDRWMLGLDVGSVAVKVVVTDAAGNLLERSYTRTHGRPVEVALRVLETLLAAHDAESLDLVAGTGSAGRLICQLLNVPFVNEVICQATALKRLHPEVRTLIEMGGQDAKLIVLTDGSNGRLMDDFTMNTSCAAGTGQLPGPAGLAAGDSHRGRIRPAGTSEQVAAANRRAVQRVRQERHDSSPAAGGPAA